MLFERIKSIATSGIAIHTNSDFDNHARQEWTLYATELLHEYILLLISPDD